MTPTERDALALRIWDETLTKYGSYTVRDFAIENARRLIAAVEAQRVAADAKRKAAAGEGK